MSTVNDLPVELWREIFEFAIGESNLLDPLYEPQNQRLRLHQFLHNENGMKRNHSSEMDGMHHSGPHSSSSPMGATPDSAMGPARRGSASRYSPSFSANLRLSPTSPSSGTNGGAPLSTSLQVKLAISATSSQWRKVGLPYLFRNVTFMSLHQLQLLTGLVRASRYRYVPGPHNIRLLLQGEGVGYGALIRRIETKIDLGKDPSDHIIYADIMSDLLKCCPNLLIYVNKNPQAGIPTPSPIINALSSIEGLRPKIGDYLPHPTQRNVAAGEGDTSLERLEWSGKEGIIVGDLTFLLRHAPYLRKLVLGQAFLCSTRLSDTLSDLQIPLLHLTSLRVDLTTLHRAYIRYTRRWSIPALQTLEVLIGSAPWQSDVYGLLECLPPLRELHLRVLEYSSMPPQTWHDLLGRQGCSVLQALTFNVSVMPALPPDIDLPNLSQVSLEGCPPDFRAMNEYDRPESDRREQLSEHLTALASRHATLRCIRMLDDEFLLISGRNAEGYGTSGWEVPRRKKLSREFRTWKEWSSLLRAAGIRLTNCEGDLIGPSY